MSASRHLLKFDGASKGNPGPASGGAVCYDMAVTPSKKVFEAGMMLDGHATNNVAEYNGLILGFKHAKNLGLKRLLVKGDSQLIINQMMGIYSVKNDNMIPLYKEAKELEESFETVEYMWVRREFNSDADSLTNEVLDGGAGFYREFGAEAEQPAEEKEESEKMDRDSIFSLFSIPLEKPATSEALETLGVRKEPVRENVLSQLFAGAPSVSSSPSLPSEPAAVPKKLDRPDKLDEILKEVKEIKELLLQKNNLASD